MTRSSNIAILILPDNYSENGFYRSVGTGRGGLMILKEIRIMKRLMTLLLSLLFLTAGFSCANGEAAVTNEARQMIRAAFENLQIETFKDKARIADVTEQEWELSSEFPLFTIEYNGQKMNCLMTVIGDPDENGLYPLYITLHGGGGGEGAEQENMSQWLTMFEYYMEGVSSGIYVACRGMKDEWNMHFLDESYAMYDRLIEDMILLCAADPNRVYLLGFSAGGDGVYNIAPRMADRFAAVNMSSGHPNAVSLLNAANLPFQIQVGIRDFYNETAMRSVRGAEFEKAMNDWREKYGFGFEHRILVHVPNGHNYDDTSAPEAPGQVLKDPAAYADLAEKRDLLDEFLTIFSLYKGEADFSNVSYGNCEPGSPLYDALMKYITEDLGLEIETVDASAVNYVSRFTRNPCPDHLLWDLSTRASGRSVDSYYWLRADFSVNQGLITAEFDPNENAFTLTPSADVNGSFSVLINPDMVDLDRPVLFHTPAGTVEKQITPDPDVAVQSVAETGDRYLAWVQEITWEQLMADCSSGAD